MSWKLYRWVWQLKAPLFIGMPPAGTLNRCRLYVPARSMWAALTESLAHRAGDALSAYNQIGQQLRETCRFTYMYPAEKVEGCWRAWLPIYEKGRGLVWQREDRTSQNECLDDRTFRQRLLWTQASTALEPSTGAAREKTLHETEYVGPNWKASQGDTQSVAMVGYVFVSESEADKDPCEELLKTDFLFIGGDTRYGFGRLRCVKCKPSDRVFGNEVDLSGSEPIIKAKRLLAHVKVEDTGDSKHALPLFGDVEALFFWDYDGGKRVSKPCQQLWWRPGSCVETEQKWTIDGKDGFWSVYEAQGYVGNLEQEVT